MKKTKIICTMGPGVTDRDKMRALITKDRWKSEGGTVGNGY